MRWFQHFTDAHDHPDLVRIMEIGGPAAYGVWWLILERIGQQLVSEKSNTAVTFSVKTWAKFCGVSSKIFLKICENLEKPGQLLLKKNEDMLTIDCPTILNYCDEYSKKRFRASKQTPESVRTNSGECPTRIEENKGEQKRKEETPLPPSKVERAKKGGREGELLTLLQTKIGSWFHRRVTTPWSEKEIAALKKIGDVQPEDLDLMQAYYTAAIPEADDIRRRDLVTLLNNWTGELDRARGWHLRGRKTMDSGEEEVHFDNA